MARGLKGYRTDDGFSLVTIQADGSGSRRIGFTDPFLAPPQVLVQENAGDVAAGASYDAVNITKDGFTIQIANSVRTGRDIEVLYFAREQS